MTTSRTLLPLVLATIDATLTSLKASTASNDPPSGETATSDQVRSDFVTLLSLISKQATNYTLALKNPPEETAARQTLEKIRDGVDKLNFIEQLSRDPNHSSELVKRIRWALSESLESLAAFLSLSRSYLPPKPTSTSKSDRDQLLSSCKTLWKVVEHVERDLPTSELDARRKTWRDVAGLIDDCEREIKDLTTPNENDDEDEHEEEEEEEEEREEREPLTEKQRSIILGCHSLLRLSRLLVVRIIALTESHSLVANRFEPIQFLSNVTDLVKRVSELGDDLAGSLEDLISISEDEDDDEVFDAIRTVVKEIVEAGESIANDVEASLKVGPEKGGREDDDETNEVVTKVREWFNVWRLQRDQARDKLKESLLS